MPTDAFDPVGSARQRLAQTRAEIQDLILPPEPTPSPAAARRAALAEMQSRERTEVAADDVRRGARRRLAAIDAETAHIRARGPRAATAFGWQSVLRHGASVWWRHHPAHAALEVADSMLAHVARRKPWQMVAVAAGVGALVMVVRPWRLVSVTGLAFAALKMTDVRSLFGSLRGN